LPGVARAQAPCASNPVACENALPGAPADAWRVDGAGDPSIQGFATTMSVQHGEPVSFKVSTPAAEFRIDVYRLGWYGGRGARLVAALPAAVTAPQTQPSCTVATDATGLIDCGNWDVSRTWAVPAGAVSGLYVAKLIRPDTGGASIIPFVVRDDARHADVLLSTSDANWQAYNDYGGNSLYACTVQCPAGTPFGYKGASKVSYNRPWRTAEASGGAPWFERAELSMLHFLEASGYDVAYTTSVDVNRRGALLKNHGMFLSSGQDEYWSASQRANVEAARDAGVNLAFFSGNEVFWKTRWQTSIAGATTADRTLVSYKDTHYDAPVDPVEWTGTWQDPRFSAPTDGGRPQNALTGQLFAVNGAARDASSGDIRVPAQFGGLRLWRNTAAATLPPGGSLKLGSSTLGFEWDVDADNGFRPAGSIRLSSTTLVGVPVFTDYGSTQASLPATHTMTMYRAPSGALVFGAGTVQWSWGLDSDNLSRQAPDVNMRQATANLFADMGAQPATRLPGVVAASESTDTAAPTSTVTSAPATLSDGAALTVSGTATDSGGVVAGVEVSTDDGASWHRAEGTTNWTYGATAHGNPTLIRTRATDDSANQETPKSGAQVLVTCPCSLWGTSVTPPVPDAGDPTAVEVGVRFISGAAGSVTGVRFYQSPANTGTHTGSLWTTAGTRLAAATFADIPGAGWRTATFETPVQIQADTTYVVSYFAPNGHYAASRGWFYRPPAPDPYTASNTDSPPLRAPRTGGVGGATTNGVYRYAVTSTFPSDSFAASNYWVDVVFDVPAPTAPSDVTAIADGPNAAVVSWSAPAGGQPASYEVTPQINGVAQPSTLVTGSPPARSVRFGGLSTGATYTFTVRAANGGGMGPPSAPSSPIALLAAPVPDPSGGGGIGMTPGPPPGPDGPAPEMPDPLVQPPPLNTVLAALKSARVVRSAGGRRRTLRITATLGETVTIAPRLLRGVRTVATAKAQRFFRGQRTFGVTLSSRVPAGRAQLRLAFTDAAGATKTVRKTLTVPRLLRR